MSAQARRPVGRVVGLALLCAAAPIGASAREEAAPPKTHRSHPARTEQAAPDRTGSIAKSPPPRPQAEAGPIAPADGAEGPLVPILLPNAPRSRMIACGQSWRSMKLNGTTGDDSWRDYALKCLVAKDAPPP